MPSCWGARGSPWSLRYLTIGGPAAEKNLDLNEGVPTPAERNLRLIPGIDVPRKPARLKSLGGKRKSRKKNAGGMYRDTSTGSMYRDTSMVSVASGHSILDSSGWRMPDYLGGQGKEKLGGLCTVLREELAQCSTQKDVVHVDRTATKILCEGNAAHFNVSGRLAYRLREAARSIGGVSSYAGLEFCHQLAFRKVLKVEVRRRQAEIAGWSDQEAEQLALATEMVEKEFGGQALNPPSSKRRAHRHRVGVEYIQAQSLRAFLARLELAVLSAMASSSAAQEEEEALDVLRMSGQLLHMINKDDAKTTVVQVAKLKEELMHAKSPTLEEFSKELTQAVGEQTKVGPHLYRGFDDESWAEAMSGRAIF